MSDTFSFLQDVPASTFDTSSVSDFLSNLPTSAPDLSSLFPSSFPASTAPLVAPVLNLPLPAGGVSNIVSDLTRLVSNVYAGEAQITAAQSAADLAKARAANQLVTVKTTPNIWVVLGLGAAAIFALELVDRSK